MMAFSHRKSLSVSVNITLPAGLVCFSFCDPKINSSGLCSESCMSTCPEVCQRIIPQLPPTPSQHHHRHLIDFPSLYPVFIVITVLAAVFFIAYCFVIYLKIYRRGSSSNLELQQDDAATHDQEEFLDEIHGPVLDHPIWYINTIGLQPSVIAAITVCRYSKDEGLIELKDCTVCLSEFEEGDTIRLLPKCSHAFHLSCIDIWLRSHTNCPMCRAGIISELVTNSDTIHIPRNDENSTASIEEVRIAVDSGDREEFGGHERDDKDVEDHHLR